MPEPRFTPGFKGTLTNGFYGDRVQLFAFT